ncbi:hypothetical protein QN239_15570 [Mycolicibacterium sp. Y3]
MSTSSPLHYRTRDFARVIGPFFAVMALIAVFRSSDMAVLLGKFSATPVWPWVTGALILLGGIAIVAFHQRWRGPAAVIVSVIGWLLIVRGIFLMAFPTVFASVANRMVGSVGSWRAGFVIVAAIGLYLTYVGWKPLTSEHVRRSEEAGAHEPPRAA